MPVTVLLQVTTDLLRMTKHHASVLEVQLKYNQQLINPQQKYNNALKSIVNEHRSAQDSASAWNEP